MRYGQWHRQDGGKPESRAESSTANNRGEEGGMESGMNELVWDEVHGGNGQAGRRKCYPAYQPIRRLLAVL